MICRHSKYRDIEINFKHFAKTIQILINSTKTETKVVTLDLIKN